MLENLKGVAEVEFLVHDGGAIDLHAIAGEGFFVLGEEFSLRGGLREAVDGECGAEDCGEAFDEEEVAPVG